MREQDVPRLASAWYELLTEYKERSLDFVEMLLRIVGVYVGKPLVTFSGFDLNLVHQSTKLTFCTILLS